MISQVLAIVGWLFQGLLLGSLGWYQRAQSKSPRLTSHRVVSWAHSVGKRLASWEVVGQRHIFIYGLGIVICIYSFSAPFGHCLTCKKLTISGKTRNPDLHHSEIAQLPSVTSTARSSCPFCLIITVVMTRAAMEREPFETLDKTLQTTLTSLWLK